MAIISIPFTFSVGAVIVASQHNSNFTTIYNDYNGNITTVNLSASAAIVDTQLAQITTAGKVSGAALITLGSIPSGSGTIPAKNGGTGGDMSAATVGAAPYFASTGVMSALGAGTSGTVYISGGAGAPTFANARSSILDYGTSASTSTARQSTAVKEAFGNISIGANSSQAITNLLFTSSSSYVVVVSYTGTATNITNDCVVNYDSGAQFTLKNNDGSTRVLSWYAIGI